MDALFDVDDGGGEVRYDHAHTGDECLICLHRRFPETDPRTLARRRDPDTSHAAARGVDATRLEAMILKDIVDAGIAGLTQDDLLALHPDLSYSSVTARPAALKAKGLIGYSGEKRRGASGRAQRVLVAAKYLQPPG